MKTVLTYGTFDLTHVGHINILRRSRALGDKLIVALSTDEFNLGKDKRSVFSYSERKTILEAIRYVDKVIPESSWDQKKQDIIDNKVDIFVMGDDSKGRFDELSELCKVVYLPRTADISTTYLKNKLVYETPQDGKITIKYGEEQEST